MFVKPGPGLKMLYPAPSFTELPESGAEVPDVPYWTRALNRGDVVLAEKPKAEPEPEAEHHD